MATGLFHKGCCRVTGIRTRFPVHSQHPLCGMNRTPDRSCVPVKTPCREGYLLPIRVQPDFNRSIHGIAVFGVIFRCHLGSVAGALPCISARFSTKTTGYAQARHEAGFAYFPIHVVRIMAEREGFEPPIELPLCLISSQT
jgi:hypothetical protein